MRGGRSALPTSGGRGGGRWCGGGSGRQEQAGVAGSVVVQ